MNFAKNLAYIFAEIRWRELKTAWGDMRAIAMGSSRLLVRSIYFPAKIGLYFK